GGDQETGREQQGPGRGVQLLAAFGQQGAPAGGRLLQAQAEEAQEALHQDRLRQDQAQVDQAQRQQLRQQVPAQYLVEAGAGGARRQHEGRLPQPGRLRARHPRQVDPDIGTDGRQQQPGRAAEQGQQQDHDQQEGQ